MYMGTAANRNGVGILINKSLKYGVVDVKRRGDRIILVKLVVEDLVLNVISAYAPQVGHNEYIKREFWEGLEDMVRSVPIGEKLFIGGDLNGHVGTSNTGIEGAHGGFSYGIRNQEGEDVLSFALAYNMIVANTLFRKRESHLVTFCSGQHSSQIDFILSRREDRRACLDCKVASEEFGVSRGRRSEDKDTWWWNDDVQKAIKEKKDCFRHLYLDRSADNIEKYKMAKKTAKRAIGEARGRAYEDLYQRLGTKEGERDIYKMAKIRERKTGDIGQVKCIKDGAGQLLVKDEEIKHRWREYFDKLFNGENESSTIELDDSFDETSMRFVRRIQESEVKEALKRMKGGKQDARRMETEYISTNHQEQEGCSELY
ncbi:unnamed protein product [Triticum aestivum]|uniref:Uncharacterized protein n=1 Tax=Triticum aestivum TaxID=4565 RepID=A0A7H4LH57_WHEAT|nr:unnamed protein product [Triticum aestivum]